MKNHVRLIFTMVYIFLAKEVFSQGTPHTIFGIVREETGNYPQATCLNFTAWIVTRPLERIVYGELGTLYQDSIWSIELSNFPTQPTTGETLVVSFSDSCENTANTITLILDMSTAYQNAGTVILYELGPPSSLTVISPNGNEMWWGGGAIQWSSAGPISYVSIYYSLDNGGNWHLITSNTPNTGIFVWDIPETTSANALVRIYSPETGIADTSDEPFVILTSPYIISPSAGEILDAGLPYTIRWNFSSYFLYVKLELSTNNGRSFSELFGVSLNDGIEIFVPPTINSDSCFIRISSVTLPIYSATSPRFSIRYTPRDTIPPATITNLQATSASSNSICLEWTAPGDDSIYGQASYYELRYNLSPITPSNWGSSIVVPVPFVPSMPGSSESFCVYGLESGTLYYFGIRTYDDATNESGISNIVSMRTQEAIVTDTIPPQWVYLELVEVGFDMVMLGWFASGDDIWDGVASHYLFALSDHNINAFNWDSLEHFLGPTPEPAGTYQRYIISGLEPGRTYYVACKVFDEAGNASRISNTVRFTTYSADNIPPARITDLHIILCDESTIVLGWSAPGDDGHMGICSGYEIRYSLTPITPLTWSSAYELPNPPEPDVAGTAQTYTATGLRSGTRYCFGIRSYDDSGNISELSNIVCGKTVGIMREPDTVYLNEDTELCPAISLDTIFSPTGVVPRMRYNDVMVNVSLDSLNNICIYPRPNINGNTTLELEWDYGGRSYSTSVNLVIRAVNDPPYFISEPSCTLAIVGVEWEYRALAYDIDGDILEYTLVDAPDGMTIEPSTGIIRFLPMPYLEGSYRVIVQVSDGTINIEQRFNIYVMKESHPCFAPYGLTCELGYSGTIPLRWQAPLAVRGESYRAMNLVLSHYMIYRAENFGSGYMLIADSVFTTTYNDVNVENGRVYYYKVRAAYRIPRLISNYSNTASGVATTTTRFYSTYTWRNININGELTQAEWSRATQIDLFGKVTLLIQNNENYLFVGLRSLRSNIEILRFYFDDDYSRSWDGTSPVDEGRFEFVVGDNRIFFDPYPFGLPGVYSDAGVFWLEFGDTIWAEFAIPTRDDEVLFVLPGDSIGFAFELITPSSDRYMLPSTADPRYPISFGTLVLGSSGGRGNLNVIPSSFSLEIEQGSSTTYTLRMLNNGNGLILYELFSEPSWLSLSRNSGFLPAFSSDNITATIEPDTLPVGTYPSQIIFSSNSGPIFVACTLIVRAYEPSRYLEFIVPRIVNGEPGEIISIPITVGELYSNTVYSIRASLSVEGLNITPLDIVRGSAIPYDWVDSVVNIIGNTISFVVTGRSPLLGSGEIIRVRYFVPHTIQEGKFGVINLNPIIVNEGEGPIPRAGTGLVVIGRRASPAWSFVVHLSDTANNTYHITLGASRYASSAYDPAFDIPAMPAMPSDFFAFTTSSDNIRLTQDIRSIESEQITWIIRTLNSVGTIYWQPNQIPISVYLNDSINMAFDSVYHFASGESIRITYNRPSTTRFVYQLYPGWNFISVPFVPLENDIRAFFPDILSDPYEYDARIGTYVTSRNLEPGKAYWILYPITRRVELEGLPISSISVPVYSGWNGIGGLISGRSVFELITSPEGILLSETLFFWDARPTAKRYVNVSSILPGYGYWIYCTENGTILFRNE